MTGAQGESVFFETNYSEKRVSEVVDHSLLTGIGSKVKISEETICIIRHIGIIKGGIDECRI